MNSQQRHKVGARTGGTATGGRYTTKPTPTIKSGDVDFDTAPTGVSCERDTYIVELWGMSTTFTRTVDEAGTVTVTVDCDDPSVLLLAKKGDGEYWSFDNWREHKHETRLWTAEITRRMLQEGFVATESSNHRADTEGIATAMVSPISKHYAELVDQPHFLTSVVALLRGLALLQSMAGDLPGWSTELSGKEVPHNTPGLMLDCFFDVSEVYHRLTKPPWQDSAAGYATTNDGYDVFVGENGDLVWRALTETDHYGSSPLKHAVAEWGVKADHDLITSADHGMITAAVLHDETAQQQLTHGLFEGVDPTDRRQVRRAAVDMFSGQLNPTDRVCCWTPTQQTRLQRFIETVEALKP